MRGMNARCDPEILRKASAGDSAAWEQILHQLHQPLTAFVQGLIPQDLRSIIEPQDVLNEAYFEATRSIGGFTAWDDDSLFRWLATIARHRLINQIKAQRRQKRGGLMHRVPAGEDPEVEALLWELAVYERTPSKSALQLELRLVLEMSMAKLKPHEREAIRLRHMSGMAFKEVALRMSQSERAVQQMCTRALRQMRQDLQSASYFQ